MRVPGFKVKSWRTTISDLNHNETSKWNVEENDPIVAIRITGAEDKRLISGWYYFIRYLFERPEMVLSMRRAIDMKKLHPKYSIFQYLYFTATCGPYGRGHRIVYVNNLINRRLTIRSRKHIVKCIKHGTVSYSNKGIMWENKIEKNYKKFKTLLIDD
jgi:hypothetical protein